MGNNQVPEVRFPGFNGEWKEQKLSELMDFSNGINAPKESYGKGRKMISVMDVLDEGPITFKNIRNSVEVNKGIEDKNRVKKGDLVFVRSSEVVEEVGWAKAYIEDEYALYSGFTIRGKKKNEYDARFIELNLNSSSRKQIERKAGGSTRFNVSQSILNSIVIREPMLAEQIKIGSFFKQLDDTIATQEQELGTLKQTKQGFLQKMFPKEGESVPEIRFPGFTDDWEQRKLGETGNFVRTSVNPQVTSNNKFVEYSMPAFDNGRLPDIVLGGSMQSSRLKISGKVLLINKLNVRQRRIWLVQDAPENAVCSSEFMPYISEVINLEFLEQLMLSDKTTRDMESISSGTSNSQKRITPTDLLNYQVMLPAGEKEQNKIGTFLKQLDNTIALHQQELDILKQTKKAFLQKMFV